MAINSKILQSIPHLNQNKETAMQTNTLEYDYSIAKLFVFSAMAFGFVGLLIGVVIAFQMAFPDLNYLASEYGTFGRLRPLHTNGIIYGFTLSGIWASWYYLGQGCLRLPIKSIVSCMQWD